MAIDLNTIHDELHTSQLGILPGTVGKFAKLRKDFPYLLYSQS